MDERLTLIQEWDTIVENVVGKTITAVEMSGGSMVFRLEGKECPTIDLHVFMVETDLFAVLWVHDDDPKAPREIPGQLRMVDPQGNPGELSMEDMCECGHTRGKHTDTKGCGVTVLRSDDSYSQWSEICWCDGFREKK